MFCSQRGLDTGSQPPLFFLPLFPTTYIHTTSLPQQEGNTKTPRQKINKTRQAICPARTTRKQDSPVCQCKQSLGNILFALQMLSGPSVALSSKHNCYKLSRKKGCYRPSHADNNNREQHKLFLRRCGALYSILINSRHSNPHSASKTWNTCSLSHLLTY